VDLRGWRKQTLYEPTNAWLVVKQIKAEEAVSTPRMASRLFPFGAEAASSLIVTFRKAVVLDGKGDRMLV
jgi:hypothetical protein